MSQPDVRTALREGLTFMAGEDGDLGEMVDLARILGAQLEAYAAPDFECIMAPLPPTPPVAYPGISGIERAWREFGEAFGSVSTELEGIEESDAAVVVLVRQKFVTAHGGVEMPQAGTMVIVIEGEHVKNVQFHLDRESALRAGGIATGPDA